MTLYNHSRHPAHYKDGFMPLPSLPTTQGITSLTMASAPKRDPRRSDYDDPSLDTDETTSGRPDGDTSMADESLSHIDAEDTVGQGVAPTNVQESVT
jgi:hypothetical protein